MNDEDIVIVLEDSEIWLKSKHSAIALYLLEVFASVAASLSATVINNRLEGLFAQVELHTEMFEDYSEKGFQIFWYK